MKKLLLIVLALFAFATGFSQSALWTKTNEGKLNLLEKVDRDSSPKEYQLFNLNLEALKTQLSAAPSRESQEVSQVVVSFPTAEGKLERFRIYESSVMAPELAKSVPQIQSYIGQGVDDPTASMAITNTIFGLHVMTLSSKGTYYVDPYTKDHRNYIVYNKSSLTTSRVRQCLTEDTDAGREIPSESSIFANDSRFRTYRLAMACTVEYAAFHIAAAGVGAASDDVKKDAVLAAMNVTVARINLVYEKDMSLRMQLVDNNRNLIFIAEDDGFDNNVAGTLINQSQAKIDAVIGNANYDIGHTVSTGGGGLAQSPSVCASSGKARGITGSPSPVGDPYDIDFVAHEVGHQFGASHTFNGEGGNCTALGTSPTRAASYAVEPGSGTTIMAYAGICSPVDVQQNSDSYFHAVSIAQMVSHITGAGNCVAGVSNGNTPPVVTALTNYTLPIGTPFVLRGSATDANNDVLTYCWEQTNAGTSTASPSATSTASNPNFRSYNPTTSSERYFPALSSLISGVQSPWEVLPNVARSMTFALTVRDNRTPSGGQTSRQNMTLNFSAVAGPFIVTSPSVENTSWDTGSTQTITWNVAGTTANNINVANVKILLSTDNGATFTTLLASTPNDGSQSVTLPAGISAPYCRIMVEAIGNVFFAVSKNLSIGYVVSNVTTCNTYTATPNAQIVGTNPPGWTAYGGITVPPTSGVISDVNLRVNITHPRINDLYVGVLRPGANTVGDIRILYQSGCAVVVNKNMITTFDDAGATLACGSIDLGNSYKPVNSLDIFNGINAAGNWRLTVADLTVPNSGTLNSFALDICTTVTTVTLSTQNFGLAEFKIYPNPNKGNFTVQFNSDSNNDIKVGVHDIRGRLILENSFQNTGIFSQNLQLSNVQSGIYIVTVQDGEKKEVKKIVVE